MREIMLSKAAQVHTILLTTRWREMIAVTDNIPFQMAVLHVLLQRRVPLT